ncbi:hypothetical protein PR048_023180 [Dryococelus australis]|uniref:Uncharacterized protein n=1 Tax=Dryococelus australis TaxID=614101 RepID=A0ABQ9GTC2_9NEOP|nr:hypothetical protein PR048_023180 [Dryococelus australis]
MRQGRGKREIPERTHRPAASSATIPTCEDSGEDPAGNRTRFAQVVESSLTTTPPRTRLWFVSSQLSCQLENVAERLACSPPTKPIRVQSPAGSLRIFARGNRAGRCRWSAGFLGDLPFPPAFHSGAATNSPQSPSSAIKISILRAVQIPSLDSLIPTPRVSNQEMARYSEISRIHSALESIILCAFDWSGEIWAALNIEVLRADEFEASRLLEMKAEGENPDEMTPLTAEERKGDILCWEQSYLVTYCSGMAN